MKRNKKYLFNCLIVNSCIIFLLAFGNTLFAQADSTKKEEKTEPVMLSPSVEFICIQRNDNSVDLKVTLKAKIKGGFVNAAGVPVEFFAVNGADGKSVGKTNTNGMGVAMLNVKPEQLILDNEGKVNFKMMFAGDKQFESVEESVSAKRARLELTAVKEDSLYTVKVRLVDLSKGTETTVGDADFEVFVNRLYKPLKLGEGKTDSTGDASVEIPNNIPGDDKGNILLIAKIEENADYGFLEATVSQPWGIPVSTEVKDLPRALWSPHPPLWMLITFIVLMVVVWGHYIFIVYDLFRLRKEPV